MRTCLVILILALAKPATGNLIANGSFELGTGYKADSWSMTYLGRDWMRLRDGALDGDWVAYCDVDNSRADPAWAYMSNDAVLPAGAYTVSLWAKADSYLPTMPLRIALGSWTSITQVDADGQWHQIVSTLTPQEGGLFEIGVFNGGDDGLFVDSVEVSAVPEASGLLALIVGLAGCICRRSSRGRCG
jgi:hypothetical protein